MSQLSQWRPIVIAVPSVKLQRMRTTSKRRKKRREIASLHLRISVKDLHDEAVVAEVV